MRRDTREISQNRVAKSGRPDATDTTLAGSIASHFSNETPVRTCFSATASFVTVGTTTAVGIACLSKVRQWRELPLASLPLIFAVQQAFLAAFHIAAAHSRFWQILLQKSLSTPRHTRYAVHGWHFGSSLHYSRNCIPCDVATRNHILDVG